jgi:hypothetical protein
VQGCELQDHASRPVAQIEDRGSWDVVSRLTALFFFFLYLLLLILFFLFVGFRLWLYLFF